MSVDLHKQKAPLSGHGFRWDTSLVPVAASQTHFHLLSIVNTEISRRNPSAGEIIRVLDVGCGDGMLLIYLSGALQACWPSLTFELYGFDVGDHGLQAPSFFRNALARLDAAAPSGRWRERLALISENDPWPYEAGFFDVVVSNQVLEHVRNQTLFFSELGRVLHDQGFSAHLYPSGHCLVEPHLHVPFAHWIRDVELLGAWLRLWSKIGFSNYRGWARTRRNMKPALDDKLDTYVREHTNFLAHLTNYKTQGEMHVLAKASGQGSSFCYTPHYYTGKLRSILGREQIARYPAGSPFVAMLSNVLLRYVSSVTLLTSSDPNRQSAEVPAAASSQSSRQRSA
ncbi:SAM-dependent methyltransferase [Pararhizobium capsulatum DSM 1112]|uniref:SAM-dependent methyltransferase n=1 Tax=Pararhizobium capsulatum DSM 1112 TaxID=1121113 RepID=A0ABU0BS81_9HYPH|nr:class I SAM-dependent methyltransferase [Pararhizobium capsulatum]MDQ0321100.1 SAM-dependent methyltransferase [Pararhizobium capsulatum DSM 1112]